jgi:transposase-like protein
MSKQTSNKFSPEVRSRAVRLVLDHEQASVAMGDDRFGLS